MIAAATPPVKVSVVATLVPLVLLLVVFELIALLGCVSATSCCGSKPWSVRVVLSAWRGGLTRSPAGSACTAFPPRRPWTSGCCSSSRGAALFDRSRGSPTRTPPRAAACAARGEAQPPAAVTGPTSIRSLPSSRSRKFASSPIRYQCLPGPGRSTYEARRVWPIAVICRSHSFNTFGWIRAGVRAVGQIDDVVGARRRRIHGLPIEEDARTRRRGGRGQRTRQRRVVSERVVAHVLRRRGSRKRSHQDERYEAEHDRCVSSGKPSTPTPPGNYRVYAKIPRWWSTPFREWLPWALPFVRRSSSRCATRAARTTGAGTKNAFDNSADRRAEEQTGERTVLDRSASFVGAQPGPGGREHTATTDSMSAIVRQAVPVRCEKRSETPACSRRRSPRGGAAARTIQSGSANQAYARPYSTGRRSRTPGAVARTTRTIPWRRTIASSPASMPSRLEASSHAYANGTP